MTDRPLTRLEKCELTRKQSRWQRWREENPTCDLEQRERDFQQGYQSGYQRAYHQIAKSDRSLRS